MPLSEILNTEKNKLQEEISRLQKEIDSAPEGRLICHRNGNYVKYYQENADGTRTYLSCGQEALRNELAMKTYHLYRLQDAERSLDLVNSFLPRFEKKESKTMRMMSRQPALRALVDAVRLSDHDWMNEPYQKGASHDESLNVKTVTGEMVRSKSEALIYGMLYDAAQAFRYECALQLQNKTVYPDFTIRHQQTGRIFYWEHFGLMDDPTYSSRTMSKLRDYAKAEHFPGGDLICTFETSKEPLNLYYVRQLIECYLL